MEDPVEINRRIQRLAQRVRRRDDYGRLLAVGEVFRSAAELSDVDAWRAEIRRQARADRIKIRTGQNGDRLWAIRAKPVGEAELVEEEQHFHLFEALESRAALHGHTLKVALRDRKETLLRCEHCDAEGYADAAAGPLIGGALFEEPCPNRPP